MIEKVGEVAQKSLFLLEDSLFGHYPAVAKNKCYFFGEGISHQSARNHRYSEQNRTWKILVSFNKSHQTVFLQYGFHTEIDFIWRMEEIQFIILVSSVYRGYHSEGSSGTNYPGREYMQKPSKAWNIFSF